MCSRCVYRARNAPKRPTRVSCPCGLTGDFFHSKHRSHPTCPDPSLLGIGNIIKYHLGEKVPKEAKVKKKGLVKTHTVSHHCKKRLPVTCYEPGRHYMVIISCESHDVEIVRPHFTDVETEVWRDQLVSSGTEELKQGSKPTWVEGKLLLSDST